MIGGGKLPDPLLNCIFNALSIGVQYKPFHFNKLILVHLRKSFLKVLVKYTLRTEM